MQQIERYEDRVTVLARVPLLANLLRESLDLLARGMVRRRLRAGAIVVRFRETQNHAARMLRWRRARA